MASSGAGIAAGGPPQNVAVLPPPPPPPPPPGAVLYNGFGLFSKTNGEPPGFGMYTYVLAGSGEPAASDTTARYKALLDAIVASTANFTALEIASTPLAQTNLFCIPAANSSGKLTVENYMSSQLATAYRLLLEKRLGNGAISRDLENHPGPFLVSSLTRLNQTQSGAPILLADLSKTHPDAMREVVYVYKQRITQDPLQQIEVFRPFKLALLNIILDGNDYVQIETVAVAGILGDESDR